MEPEKQSETPKTPEPSSTRPGIDILPHARRTILQSHVVAPQEPTGVVAPPASPATMQKPPATSSTSPQPITPDVPPKRHLTKKTIILGGVGVLIALIVAVSISLGIWYQTGLNAVTSDKKAARVRVTIQSGSTDSIARLLEDKKVIRSAPVFSLYARLHGVQSQLQAGEFSLLPTDDVPTIIGHLVAGKTDEFALTFLPGETLSGSLTGHIKVLKSAGYSDQQIQTALGKTYSGALFADKPAGSDLEGYIYGETYNFTGSASVEDILSRTFEQFEKVIKENDLQSGFQKQGLTLYQGITLASIIQREVSDETAQKQVAQVFLKRLHEGGTLGSDVTFIYAAKKLGIDPTPTLDSPYNTRIHPGLPPGPISSPGLPALIAVANPAPGNYSYFLAGDDGKTYFANTYDEHQENIAKYCHKLCS